jgi:hypothetical protein
MQIYYTSKTPSARQTQARIDFDVDSIRQVLAAEHGSEPDFWVADAEGYEANGHGLRDSESIRLIAYSRRDCIIYATDGCNACRHILGMPLETCPEDELAALSERIQLPTALLKRLAEALRGNL